MTYTEEISMMKCFQFPVVWCVSSIVLETAIDKERVSRPSTEVPLNPMDQIYTSTHTINNM